MKSLQMKYNLLHILYWITSCSIYGYVAVFLHYKGLSNTEIGIVTGAGAVLSVFVSPFFSSLLTKIPGLTIKKLTLILYIMMVISFITLTFLNLPAILIMALYITLIVTLVSVVPFLSMICMDYLKVGHYINFGLARGMGSVSYAVSAVVLGQLIDMLNPTIIGYVHFIGSILLLLLLFSMPDVEIKEVENEETEVSDDSMMTVIKSYKTFFLILVAFGFMFAGSTTLGTYMINIVNNLGGNTSFYGIVIFFMAASEMPIMAATHSLLKKYSSETLILIASVCYILRNFTIAFAPNLIILVIGAMFQSVSYGLLTATITYYVSDHLANHHQMMGQTLIGAMTTGLGSSIGNVLGGILQDTLGLSSMLYFACLMTAIGTVIMFFTLKNKINKKKVKSYQ